MKLWEKNNGVISRVKGAFNLCFRGKRRVNEVLGLLEKHPIIIGDIAKTKIEILKQVVQYLEQHRGHAEHQMKTMVMFKYRSALRQIKEKGFGIKSFPQEEAPREAIGYFLAGIIDAEGSLGMKRSGDRFQPYIAIAMRDRKIIDLAKQFLGFGNVRLRKDGLWHYETNDRESIGQFAITFLNIYPLRHIQQRSKLVKLQWILNDYTPNAAAKLRKSKVQNSKSKTPF